MPQSKEYLRKLRQRYKLGEYSKVVTAKTMKRRSQKIVRDMYGKRHRSVGTVFTGKDPFTW